MKAEKSMDKQFRLLNSFKVGPILRTMARPINYGLQMHNVPERWLSTRGKGIRVAVIDTGLPKHRDLKAAIKASANFTNDGIEDTQGHSTHVSGIIAARSHKEQEGLTGIAPDCELIIAKALGDNGGGGDSSLADAIDWSVDHGAHIINMSLGAHHRLTRYFQKTLEACERADRKGVILICAAGNENASKVNLPGRFPQCITVGAVNSARERAWFSNRGRHLDFAAAGVDIWSTYKNNTYVSLDGSSMACPQITGVCALILSEHRNGHKHKTPIKNRQHMYEHLQRISVDYGDAGFDKEYGWGIPVFGHINPDDPANISEAVQNKPKSGFSLLDLFIWQTEKLGRIPR